MRMKLGLGLGKQSGTSPAPIITGTAPVLAALTTGQQLSARVTWGSYASTAGTINATTKQMSVNGGAWATYVGTTAVAEGETWQVREVVTDTAANSLTFTSASQAVPYVVPAAFTAGQWALANPGTDGDLTITISALPASAAAITALQYQIDGGSWVSLGGTTTGTYTVSGLTNDVEVDVNLRAVNSAGNGAASDTKSATPTEVPADTTAPEITDEAYDAGTDDLTAIVNEDCTLYAMWSSSASLSNAAIESGATVTEALTLGENVVTGPTRPTDPGTYYLQWLVKDAAGNITQGTPVEYVVFAVGYTETWEDYSVGNTFTQVDAAYTRDGTQIGCTVVTDADGPDGKALSVEIASTSYPYSMFRDDITAYLATRASEPINILFKSRAIATTNALGGIGELDAATETLFTGARIARGGANTTEVRLQYNAAPTTTTNTTVLASNITDGAVFWVRLEIDGVYLRGKYWLDGESEPGSWTTYTAGASIPIIKLRLMARAYSPVGQVLGYSVVLDDTAPGF